MAIACVEAPGERRWALYSPPPSKGPGEMLLRAEGAYLTGVFFIGQKHCPTPEAFRGAPDAGALDAFSDVSSGVLKASADQLDAWFAGALSTFDLPLLLHGSDLQRRVWQHLAMIPYGERVTYGALARALDLPPGHARAVGSAVGRNPLLIVLPCHRVVAADGSLRGYAGGLERKAWLLAHEGARPARSGAY